MPDAVQEILARVERPVEPRREFDEALLRQLLTELEPAPRRRWRFAALPLRVRVALVVLLVLLLVGAAAATYFGVRTWLSAGPRGVQFTSDFALAEIYRDDSGSFYPDFKLAPAGEALYALRQPSHEGRERHRTMLVRLSPLKGESADAEVVLDFGELTDPALWDPGVDLSGAVLGTALHQSGDDVLAIAEDGGIFVIAAVWDPAYAEDLSVPARATSLLVLRPDGGRQKVLTLRELLEAVRPDARDDELFSLSVAASAPDLLWVKLGDFPEPNTVEPVDSFFQVHDPDADGDWSDRTIQPLAVPPSISRSDAEISQMVPETGRPASVLVPVQTRTGEYLVHRISDGNADGDALDEGETEVVFTAMPGFSDFPVPVLVARTVFRDSRVAVRELLAGGLVRRTRISRISESGETTDIARAFHHLEDLAAAPDGNIYVVDQLPSSGERNWAWIVFRLTPVGESLAPGITAEATQPTAETETAAPAAPAGVPLIAFATERFQPDEEGEIFVIGADGSGLRKLVPGKRNHGFCQSADGSRMAYWSDEEAPREAFTYVADADGTNARKVTERYTSFWCNFSEKTLPLVVQGGQSMTLIRHDLETGKETTLVRNVDRLVISPDGTQMLFVAGLDFERFPPKGEETLELVNVDTGERRRLDGPSEDGSYLGAQWSKDGRRIAYFVGPPPYPDRKPGRYDLYVRDLAAERAGLLRSFEGGPPLLSWSASGASLLVCIADGGTQSACSGDSDRGPEGRLWRVDAETGAAKLVGEGKLLFSGWHPTEESFAYADERTLFIVSVEGDAHELAAAPDTGWPVGYWLGWSPDGSYIGLGDFSKRLGVVDVETGEVRILLTEGKEGEIFEYRKWWRPTESAE